MSANLIAQLNVKTQGMVDKSVAYCRPEVTPMLPVMRNIKFNSSPIAATLMRAAVVLLIVVAASMAGWAAETICPASPNYSPDFTLNRGCLPPNGVPLSRPRRQHRDDHIMGRRERYRHFSSDQFLRCWRANYPLRLRQLDLLQRSGIPRARRRTHQYPVRDRIFQFLGFVRYRRCNPSKPAAAHLQQHG